MSVERKYFEEIKQLEAKLEIELRNNNGLRKYIQMYRKVISDIDKLTLHAGCMGNPECYMCPIQKIIIENRKEIQKRD